MKYVMINKDYGQGSGYTVLPVSSNSGKFSPCPDRAYTAFEVLTNFFEEDMHLVLNNYIDMEIETIKDHGGMVNRHCGNVSAETMQQVCVEAEELLESCRTKIAE